METNSDCRCECSGATLASFATTSSSTVTTRVFMDCILHELGTTDESQPWSFPARDRQARPAEAFGERTQQIKDDVDVPLRPLRERLRHYHILHFDRALHALGRLEEAGGLLTRVLATRRELLGEGHPHVALTKKNLAALLLERKPVAVEAIVEAETLLTLFVPKGRRGRHGRHRAPVHDVHKW